MTTSTFQDPSVSLKTNHNQNVGLVSEVRPSYDHQPPEILAPVGGRQQFFAALNSGADAVFLGLKQFNARARAENFSIEDLSSLVPLAHRYGMRVLVTLNILIKDVELGELVQTLADLEDVGVDAIIVQDLGVASLARKYFPGLRLHASTQMAVHNLAGVQKAYEWGFKRVVLARELTAQEIKRIRAAVPKELIELEVFCHGSLCYSYSGLCFFSGAADARSGNRGECAYTCREPYKIISEPGQGFLFSMRDLDTAHKLNLMVEAGVDTLKIEGRKKDAQYVSSVVKLYRKKLNDLFGKNTLRASAPPLAQDLGQDLSPTNTASESQIREDMKLSFQRQTTSFFFEGRYHENVIDLNSPTHHGMAIGRIEKVLGRTLHVRLEKSLERFDGVKIVSAAKVFHAKPQDGEEVTVQDESMNRRYANREAAFSVKELKLKGRVIFEASAGMLVEITFDPKDLDTQPDAGDILFKVRSAELKRRVETLTKVPVDERLRPMRPLTASLRTEVLDDGALRLTGTLFRLGEIVAAASIMLDEAASRKQGLLSTDIKASLEIFGDEGFYVEEFTWNIDESFFVPRSKLKDLKRRLEENLAVKSQAISAKHLTAAKDFLASDLFSSLAQRVSDKKTTYELKIDRISYLPWISKRITSGDWQDLKELIFEPKKMYLTGLDAGEFLIPLTEFRDSHGLKIRLALPTVIRAWDEPVLKQWLKAAAELGFNSYEIGNVGALAQLKNWGLETNDITSDFMLYGMNREAVKFWQSEGLTSLCLSIEDDWTDLESLLAHWPQGIDPTAILYKDTPLFVAESCSLTALHNGCPTSKVCGYRSLEIENSKGERFVVAHEGCKSVVYGKQAYSITGARQQLESAGVKRFRLDFLTRPYTEVEFTAVVNAALEDKALANTHAANFHGALK